MDLSEESAHRDVTDSAHESLSLSAQIELMKRLNREFGYMKDLI